MSIQAHMTKNGLPIPESAICSRCEGDAGRRISSWMSAKADPDYNGSSRETVEDLFCSFCGEDE